MDECRVLLTAMPWNRPDYPSIQIGRLKAFLIEHGVECESSYSYLDLVEDIGQELYIYLVETMSDVLMEGIFSSAEQKTEPIVLYREFVKESGLTLDTIKQVFRICYEFIEKEYSRVDWGRFSHVGFTCTFAQTWASLAMAKVVKERHPQLQVIFGGSAINEEVARYVERQFPFVDHLITGPGELALLDIVQNQDAAKGCRHGPRLSQQHLAIVPNYEEYFARLVQGRFSFAPTAILTTSMGCEHGSCAFCALNIVGRYLVLPGEAIWKMVSQCAKKYPVERIEYADTSLVAVHSDANLSRKLRTLDVEFFGEIRATLTDAKSRRLKKAGFSGIQIGIESLSTAVLTAMVKNTDLVQNLYNLKLCLEHELEVGYNLILDFPGTTDEYIQQMIDLLPRIAYLPPPTALCRFVLYKGAPVFSQPNFYGITNCHPSRHYRLALGELYGNSWPATRYDYLCETTPSDEILSRMDSACITWADEYDPEMSLLTVEYRSNQALVTDRRMNSQETYVLRGESLQCLRYCDVPRRADRLKNTFMPGTVRELEQKNLLIVDNNRVLSLPVTSRRRRMRRRGRPDSEFAQTTTITESICTLTSR